MEFIPLGDDELAKALGEVSHSVRQRIQEKTALILRDYPDVTSPTITYDLRGHTGGWAINGTTIRLNSDILNDPRYTEDMIENTLPHEIAHIICQQRFPNKNVGHGYEWRRIMYDLGLEPDRCHQYETKAVRKKSRPYAYYCRCPEPHMVTATLHRRIQEGRVYKCRRCGAKLREG